MKTIKDFQGKNRELSKEVYVILLGEKGTEHPSYKPGLKVRKISGVDGKNVVGYHFAKDFSTVCDINAECAEFCGIRSDLLAEIK